MAIRDQADTFFENNDRILRFTMTDIETGNNLDLTVAGRVSRFAIARIGANGPLRAGPVVEKNSVNAGEIIFNPSGLGNHVADVVLDAADTVDFAAAGSTDYYFEFEIIDGAVSPLVLATGTLTIEPNVENA